MCLCTGCLHPFCLMHHKASANCVEGVRQDACKDCDDLSEAPHDENVCFASVREQNCFSSVKATEVSSTVSNDSDD